MNFYMKRTEKEKMYVIKKYIRAFDVKDAMRKADKTPIHEIYLDNSWTDKGLPSAIGFEDDSCQDDYLVEGKKKK